MAIIALQAPPKRKQPFLAMVPAQVDIAVMAIIAWRDGEVDKPWQLDASII
jgi:hypothetical protein